MPGETILGGLWISLALSGAISAGAWTYFDAKARGSGSVSPLWGLAVAGFLPLVPVYLYLRTRIGDRDVAPTSTERTLAVWAIGAVFAILLAPIVAPPESVTVGWYLLGLFPVGILIGYGVVYRR